jgi:hypothetical protein
MKKVALLIIAIAGVFITLTAETNSDNGKAGYTNSPNEGNCTTSGCHDSYTLNSGGGSVTISSSNMTGWVYDPGVTYHMTVTVARSANSLFGVCVEALTTANANAGTLVITNSAKTSIKSRTVSGVSRRSVVHTLNGGANPAQMAFNFDWTAPASNIGDVTFYFAGVAANADGNETGDYVYTGSQVVNYNTLNSIATINTSTPISVYPMPVQDHFSVNYTVNTSGPVSIKLYTMQGALAADLGSKMLAKGDYTDNFYLPANLSSGNYLLNIESESGLSSRKILINQ